MAYLPSLTNGGTIADAINHFDALDKMINFITVDLPVAEQWIVLKDDITSVANERFVYLQGPGNGTDLVHVNIRVYSIETTDVRNWEIRGSTGFETLVDFYNQPGGTTIPAFLTFSDDVSMPFHFVANGRRIILVFKIVAVYVSCHLGFYLPYATPSEIPYPMYNGGNSPSSTLRWDVSTYQIGNYYDGPYNSVTDCVGHIRHRDGTWLPCGSFGSSSGGARPNPASINSYVVMLPFLVDAARPDFSLMAAPDGTYPLISPVLYTALQGGNTFGELEGLFFVPARDNTTESIIIINAKNYLVIQNNDRAFEANCAILLE